QGLIVASQREDTLWTPAAEVAAGVATPVSLVTWPVALLLAPGEVKVYWLFLPTLMIDGTVIDRYIYLRYTRLGNDTFELSGEVRPADDDAQAVLEAVVRELEEEMWRESLPVSSSDVEGGSRIAASKQTSMARTQLVANR